MPKNAIACPNDQCEASLAWPEDDPSHLACPECHRVLKKVAKPKEDIRSLTHLHHALDASTIALIAHYFPLTKNGENVSGKIWKALMSRNKSEAEAKLLSSTGLFKINKKLDDKGRERTRAYLHDLDLGIKDKLIARLAEARVAQHIPADRSGTRAELTTWGVTEIEGTEDGQRIKLHQNATVVKDGRRIRTPKERSERPSKLLGPNPTDGRGKLKPSTEH